MNKIKKIVPLSFLAMLLAHGCGKRDESRDDKLTLARVDYTGSELRINGYYYEKDKYREQIHVVFLYRNGVILDVGVLNNFEELEERCRNGYYSTYPRSKFEWGVFQVDDSKIKYEKWVPGDGPLSVFTYEGTILNDTIYVIYELYRNVNGEKTQRLEVYDEFHFREFSPKPDSVNRFIE